MIVRVIAIGITAFLLIVYAIYVWRLKKEMKYHDEEESHSIYRQSHGM